MGVVPWRVDELSDGFLLRAQLYCRGFGSLSLAGSMHKNFEASPLQRPNFQFSAT